MPFASKYNHRRRLEPFWRPPPDGRCAIDQLPDELWLDVLSHFDWEELMLLRRTCHRVGSLVLSPALHQSLTVPCRPVRHMPLVLQQQLLPLALHLYITDAPTLALGWRLFNPLSGLEQRDAVVDILHAVPVDRLLTLSLRCMTGFRMDMIGTHIARVGGRLERLDLHGAQLNGALWTEWMRGVGVAGNGLRELDLAVSSITTLPIDLPWHNLEVLSLRSCYLLQGHELRRFLANLPPKLRILNLSYLTQLSLDALRNLRVTVTDAEGKEHRTALSTVHLVGIDHFTRSDVCELQRHWSERRLASESSTGDTEALLLDARHETVTTWPCRSQSASGVALTPAATQPSTPPSSQVPTFPRTPESATSELMPTTPDSLESTNAIPPYRYPPTSPPTSHPSPGELRGTGAAIQPSSLPSFLKPPPPFVFRFEPRHRHRSDPDHPVSFITRRPRAQGNGPGAGPGPGAWCRAQRDKDKVTIFHSALLESDDEAGYRRFIGEVVDGTLGADWGELQDLEFV